MVFLFHYIEFLLMCNDNNINCINFQKSQTMLNKIFTFVKENYKNENLHKALKYMKSLYNELNDKDFIKNTMRMTMFD